MYQIYIVLLVFWLELYFLPLFIKFLLIHYNTNHRDDLRDFTVRCDLLLDEFLVLRDFLFWIVILSDIPLFYFKSTQTTLRLN